MSLKTCVRDLSWIFAASFITVSCADTEVVSSAMEGAQKITLHVGSVAPQGTRVADGMQLRYVAKLYKGTKKGDINEANYLNRCEVLAKDGGQDIVFQAQTGVSNYMVSLFADYIPTTSVAENGCYPDKYYNTQNTGDYVEMTKNWSATETMHADANFNNDAYDCFGTVITIAKSTAAYETDVTLPRIVSKVKVKAKSGDMSGIAAMKIKQFSYIKQYSFANTNGTTPETIGSETLVETKQPSVEPVGGTDKVLFWFYTFPGTKNIVTVGDIAFGLTDLDGKKYARTILGGTIVPVANKIINVNGDFLNGFPIQSSTMTLHVSSDDNWGDDSTEVSVAN